MTAPHIVSREEWIEARKQLLEKEKALTRQRDQVNAELRQLPWVKVDKEYTFDSTEGKKTLSDLFGGKSQLIVQHFMFGPDWDEGCVGCSFAVDHVEAAYQHVKHHDLTYVLVSRGPLDKLQAYKKRLGWTLEWVSSLHSDFNFDFDVSFTPEEIREGRAIYNFRAVDPEMAGDDIAELPGISVFYRDESGDIYHTYSSYARGGEEILGAYMLLDATPKGRNEGSAMEWVRRHDEYETTTEEIAAD